MKKETVKQFFQFLEKKEGKENIEAKLVFSPESIPEGFQVEKPLHLEDFPITSLPKGLRVRGNLYLTRTPITKLPEGLVVRGYLDCRESSIESVPSGLKVGIDLFIHGTPLVKNLHTTEKGLENPFFTPPEEITRIQLAIKQEIERKGGQVKGRVVI